MNWCNKVYHIICLVGVVIAEVFAASSRRKDLVDLRVSIGSLQLRNPTILASGVLGVTAGGLVRAWRGGAGAVVTKTVGLKAQPGHPGPRLVGLRDGSLLNAMGLPNPGVDDYLTEVKLAQEQDVLVIGSVMGDTSKEFATVAERLAQAGVAGLELNVSCPHVGSLYQMGLQPGIVSNIVRAVTQRVGRGVPVWLKLPGSTDYPQLIAVAQAAAAAGAAAVVAINTLPALALDVDAQRPLLGGGIGGLSGPPIKPVAIRAVWELYRAGLTIPIVGVGGVLNGNDVVEFLIAGATAVEIGTGVLLRGSNIFQQICRELTKYMQRHQIRNLQNLVGRAHDYNTAITPDSSKNKRVSEGDD